MTSHSAALGAGGGAGVCPSFPEATPFTLLPAPCQEGSEQSRALCKVLMAGGRDWAAREHVENHPGD